MIALTIAAAQILLSNLHCVDSTYKVVYQLSLSQLSSTNDHETNVKHYRYHRALVEAGMAAT